MSQEFLSQDEVDTLLKGVDGDAKSAAEPAAAGAVQSYDLARQARIVRARMPTLEIINERFARLLRIGLHGFMRRSPEISVGPVRAIKYGEFIRNLVAPANLNIVQPKPLRGNALFVLDPSLVFTVVDNLFGGDGRFNATVDGRDFTPTEQRIIRRLLGVVLEEYAKSWQPVHALRFEFTRSETLTRFASIAAPDEMVVATTFSIDLGSGGGALHICIPYASIEPIRDLLSSTTQSDHMAPDRRWLGMLSKQVQTAEVELAAQLARIPVPVRELLAMKVGDVIGFDLPDTVNAEVDGVPIFECRYGTLNSQYALKIERVLALRSRDNSLGDEHAA